MILCVIECGGLESRGQEVWVGVGTMKGECKVKGRGRVKSVLISYILSHAFPDTHPCKLLSNCNRVLVQRRAKASQRSKSAMATPQCNVNATQFLLTQRHATPMMIIEGISRSRVRLRRE